MPRPKFPHFTLEESKVMEELLIERPIWGDFKFDVHLTSKKFELAKIENETLRRMWHALTAKRIDAVCDTGKEIYIIEVKRMMLASGIGQLLLYAHMYNKEFKPEKPVKLLYATYYPDPDVEEFCRQIGIKTWSVVR